MEGTGPEHQIQASADEVATLVRALASEYGRRIPVPGTLNFRDAGGYPVSGGGVIRWRQLLRSDALHLMDRAAADLLLALSLRTIIDLRTSYEAQIAPSPLDDLAGQGAMTMHISLIGEDMEGLPDELGSIYDYIIDRRGTAIGHAIRSLARPGAFPALVHCTAGKDRTGIVIALTLAAVGVPDQVIAADYALTSLYLDPEHTPTIGHVQESTGLGERLTAALLASPPGLIVRTLERARLAGGGSIAGYLASCGVPEAELGALRAALVTSACNEDEGGRPHVP
jgi:protein-tyrosine phosphatase